MGAERCKAVSDCHLPALLSKTASVWGYSWFPSHCIHQRVWPSQPAGGRTLQAGRRPPAPELAEEMKPRGWLPLFFLQLGLMCTLGALSEPRLRVFVVLTATWTWAVLHTVQVGALSDPCTPLEAAVLIPSGLQGVVCVLVSAVRELGLGPTCTWLWTGCWLSWWLR